MSLVTGQPIGNLVSQEELYIEGAPNIYVQDYEADPLWNPDSDGAYWGMSGTSSYPVDGLACVTDVSFGQGVTANDIRCDAVGNKGTIQRRDYVELTFTLESFFPLSTYRKLANFGTAITGTGYEKIPIGAFNNDQYWMIYAPKVYNESVGDYLLIHLHKCQFVEPGAIEFRSGEPWMQQFTVRAFADDTKPSDQRFGWIIRADASAL